MPSGMAAEYRELVASNWAERAGRTLQLNPNSKTGYVGVIQVKGGLFQARVQVRGDGRGGNKKRKQHSLPGLFKSPEEAAFLRYQHYAEAERHGELSSSPPKQNKKHKSRQQKQAAAPEAAPPPVQLSMALAPPTTVMGVPIPFVMQHAPLVAASPLPMQSLGYTPPFGMRS